MLELSSHEADITEHLSEDLPVAPKVAPKIVLHDYQVEIVRRTLEALRNGARPIIPLATGAGKTILAADIVATLRAEFKRVLILVHRQEIGQQTIAKLKAHGVRCGAIMASAPELERPQEPVQVTMVQTLHTRCIQSKRKDLPPADIVFVDECHHTPAKTYLDILAAYPAALKVGLSATPCRADGRGLGDVFDMLIEVPTPQWLIEKGYLVKPLIFAPIVKKDIAKGVRVSAGDYNIGHLCARMDTHALVGDIISDYLTHGQRRPAICFAINLQHARHIVDEMVKHGIRAEYLAGDTGDNERAEILQRLRTGATEVVVNVAVLGEGFDAPNVGCLILARPTKSLLLYLQMVGRALRADGPNKKDAIIIDHSGAVYLHDLPQAEREWELHPDRKICNREQERRKRGEVPGLCECPQCHALRVGGMACENCGWKPEIRGRRPDFAEGELGLIEGGQARANEMALDQQIEFYRMLRGFAHARGMKSADGWVFYKCQEKGFKPPWAWKENYTPLPPSPAVASWAKSRLIAYAKRRAA